MTSLKNRVFWFTAMIVLAYIYLVHFMLIYVIPDPIFMNDSVGYLYGPLADLVGKPLSIPSLRAIGYPFFLRAVLQFSSSFRPVLLLQHGMQIVSAALMAVLFWRHSMHRWLALLLFSLLALQSRTLYLTHAIMTEPLYVFLQTVTLYCASMAVRKSNAALAITTGALVTLAFNTRDIGISLLFAGGVCLILFWRYRRVRRLGFWIICGIAIAYTPFLVYNQTHRKILGTERRSLLWVFGNMSQYLDLSRVEDPHLKQCLSSFYDKPLQERLERQDPNWPYMQMAKIIENDPILRDHTEKLYGQLIWQILRNAPVPVFRDDLQAVWIFLRLAPTIPRADPGPADFLLMRGFQIFADITKDIPAARRYLTVDPSRWPLYASRIRSIPLFPFNRGLWIWEPAWLISSMMSVMPLLGIVSGVLLLGSRRHALLSSFCLASIGAQILPFAAGAGYSNRYIVTLEPFFALLAWLAASEFLKMISRTPHA